MPLYVFHGLDKPGALELRKATRQTHLDWLASLSPRVKIGGPMLAEDGATPVGSMLVLEADSLEAAKAEYARDPYNAAGLWQTTSVRPFNWLVKQ
ncbi:MAG: YciI family protein [Hyphomonadaceae bacterium]|nr:YciI family protein [Hyphomonadaceae bacterium]MBP9234200.1 YciI family protein [Hyphomonadaceae bacterium]